MIYLIFFRDTSLVPLKKLGGEISMYELYKADGWN